MLWVPSLNSKMCPCCSGISFPSQLLCALRIQLSIWLTCVLFSHYMISQLSTTDTLDLLGSLLWECPVHCSRLSSIPGFTHQVPVPPSLSPSCNTQQYFQAMPSVPWGINWPRGEPWLQMHSEIDQAAPSEMFARIGAQNIEIDFTWKLSQP